MTDAERVLRDLIDKITREQKYSDHEIEVKSITSGGANYTSALFLIDLKFKDKDDVKLFAKVAAVSEKFRSIMGADRLYYLEAFFYNKLSKTYIELQKNIAEEDKFIHPKFYGCSTKIGEETVVLENLVARGYNNYDRFNSMDWDHAASSIESLAKFHAMSFAYQKANPEEFEEVCKDLAFIMPDRDEGQSKAFWGKAIERSLAVLSDENKARVLKSLETNGVEAFLKFRQPIDKKVIIHGDYRPSNLLFKREGSKIHTMPIDFQTIHVGSPASDLVYFILLGTDSAFRAAHYDRLVQHYYEELSQAMQRLNVDSTEVYPREMFDKELQEMLPYSIMLSVILLPVVLVEAENAPRTDDADADLTTFFVKGNDLFEQRFRGIVDDCIKWGVL